MSLAALQREFHRELVDDEPRSPLASHPGFAVHRNTVLRAAIDALEANFPAVACLVGTEWFRSAAAAYAGAHPARDARLVVYGAAFPDFLAEAPAAAELPYLADVARLDRLWTESYIAADAPALGSATIRALHADALAELVVMPHPATRVLGSTLPAFAIWQASRAGEAVADELAWEPQSTLITRPEHTVTATTTDAPALAFLDACRTGATLPTCVDAVLRAHPQARTDLVFAHVLTTGALAVA